MNITHFASQYADLKMFLLLGSRARGDQHEDSDWDFGYIAKPEFDSMAFYTDLVLCLGTTKLI